MSWARWSSPRRRSRRRCRRPSTAAPPSALCAEAETVRALQRQADRICELIVSGDVPLIDIEIQQAALREAAARAFPDKQALYQLLYESRFRRLWQQFRRDIARAHV